MQLGDLLQQQIANHKTPGLYYAFFNAEKILYEYSGGKADLSSGLLANAKTAFYGFSVTKTFTATAVQQLIAKGKLQLDDLVKTHLPDFIYGDEIRVRHLLAHSSGLPNPMPIQWIHLVEEHATFEEQRFFDDVFQKKPKARQKPNERFVYSNLGYVALGRVIEQVSGISYREYITRYILQPLGISESLGFERLSHWDTATGYHRTFSLGNFLLGFLLDKTKFMGEKTEGWTSFRPCYVNGSAYGGLIGLPGAFMAFAQDLLKPEGVLLPSKFREEMFRENHLNNGKATGMSLGWYCGQLKGMRFVAHAGGGGGYYCELRIYPEIGLGSIVMTNRSGFSDERMLNKFDPFFIT